MVLHSLAGKVATLLRTRRHSGYLKYFILQQGQVMFGERSGSKHMTCPAALFIRPTTSRTAPLNFHHSSSYLTFSIPYLGTMSDKDSRALFNAIADLEEETWGALSKSGEAMIPFISDDCIMQFPLGMKLTSKSSPSVLDILRSPAFIPWKSFRLSKIDVQPLGTDAAVISYLAKATRPPAGDGDNKDAEFEALCCSVWRRQGETLKMCFHQQTLAT